MKDTLLKIFFPPVCPICGEVIHRREICCEDCRTEHPVTALHFPVAVTEQGTVYCRPLYPYHGAVREGLLVMKFAQQRGRAEGFGRLMGQQVSPADADVVTFVPMDLDRERFRGYNQARLLAEYCSRESGIPMRPLLEKTRRTHVQHDLNGAADRERNVEGAYRALPLKGERVLLCDDITTTGATLRTCARALLEAGASQVACICVAWANG